MRAGCRSRCAARSASTRAGAWHSTNSTRRRVAESLGERLSVGAMAERRVDDHATAGGRRLRARRPSSEYVSRLNSAL